MGEKQPIRTSKEAARLAIELAERLAVTIEDGERKAGRATALGRTAQAFGGMCLIEGIRFASEHPEFAVRLLTLTDLDAGPTFPNISDLYRVIVDAHDVRLPGESKD